MRRRRFCITSAMRGPLVATTPSTGHFRREVEIRGSRGVIHGRCWFLPKALREMGNWVAHKAHGPTPVALQSRENELSFLVLDDAKFRALVWSFGPSISFVHSGRVLRAELALCALVERNGAGVLTEGRRRWPARLKILGLRLRSGDREFDVRGADVEKPSSARNPKDKPAWLGAGFFDHKRARDGGATVVVGATAPGWTCAGGFFKSSSSQVKLRRGVAMRKTA